MRIKIFADGADYDSIAKLNEDLFVEGFTTNPTLMRKAGILNYLGFAEMVLKKVTEKPVSFEVFSDDSEEMVRQAHVLSGMGNNVYVKIPIMKTTGFINSKIINSLSREKIKINVTAVTSRGLIQEALDALETNTPSILSIFAGRIADAGVNPVSCTDNNVTY